MTTPIDPAGTMAQIEGHIDLALFRRKIMGELCMEDPEYLQHCMEIAMLLNQMPMAEILRQNGMSQEEYATAIVSTTAAYLVNIMGRRLETTGADY